MHNDKIDVILFDFFGSRFITDESEQKGAGRELHRHTYRQLNRRIGKQTRRDRQTDRLTDGQTDRQSG